MTIDIRIEKADELDPQRTSSMARNAFHKGGPELSPERFAWTYRDGYDRATLVSAFSEGEKVGQLAAFYKTVLIDGEPQTAAELADLFVAPPFRSFQAVSSLYKELKKAVTAEGARLIYAYANESAALLNKRFFKMEEITRLPVRVGLSVPMPVPSARRGIGLSRNVGDVAALYAHLSEKYPGGGATWSREAFAHRIGSPVYSYVWASNGECAMLASPRVIRSVPVLLICATFGRIDAAAGKGTARALIGSLCRATGRHLYLYAGWNDAVRFSGGFAVPEKALGGKFVIQSNFLNSQREKIGRFEILDIDYG